MGRIEINKIVNGQKCFICPDCRNAISNSPSDENKLICSACKATYPVLNNIPVLMPKGHDHVKIDIQKFWKELYQAGERIRQLEKAMQLRYGFRKEHDFLPDHYYNTPVESGQFEGTLLDKQEFTEELENFYKLRGWDKEGFPFKESLVGLGLEDVAQALEKEGLLAGPGAKKKAPKKQVKKPAAKKSGAEKKKK